MIKLIYFDFGAVLVNYNRVFQKVCSDFNLDVNKFWEFYGKFDSDMGCGKITTNQFWEECIKKFKIENGYDYNLPKAWVSDYSIIQPIHDLIYSLEGKINIGIISNICSGIWEAALEDGWVPNIKYKKVYLSYDLKMVKPDPALFALIQSESSVKPDEILFVDDMEENLIAPKNLGWKTVLFDQYNAEDGVKKIKEIIQS